MKRMRLSHWCNNRLGIKHQGPWPLWVKLPWWRTSELLHALWIERRGP